MDLNYFNKKLCENIFEDNKDIISLSNGNKVYVFSLYEGYDIYLLIDYLLNEIKSMRILGNIYMINFSDYLIKIMNNNYNIDIDIITNKNKNEIGKIFSVTDRVFLKDLISKEIFISQISAIIISPTTYYDLNEKIWCIHKFLNEEGKNILFFYFLQNQRHYNFFFNSLNKSIKITSDNFKNFIIPRNNVIIEKIINRKFVLNKLSLIEININDNDNRNNPVVRKEIKELLEQLMTIIYEEIIKNIPTIIGQENNIIFNKLLSEYYEYRKINNDDSINNIHFKFIYFFNEKNSKLKNLYYDLLSIKFLIKKCESYDIASLYNIFKEIKTFSEKENSIFSYQDSTTENLIFELNSKFKNNLYSIQSLEKKIISEEESVILDEFFELYIFINMSQELKNDLRKILEQNIIELKSDNEFFRINYYKYIQLINVLETKIINNQFKEEDENNENNIKKEEILIIANNESEIDNLKSIFNIYGINKKLSNNDKNFFTNEEYILNNKNIFKEFFEYNFRKFLINKREFLTRYKIISNIKSAKNISNYTKENLFLHYLCYQLTRSFDIKNEGLFDRIYDMYQKNNNEIDLLPSEFAEEMTEDIFNDYIQQNFNEEETFPFIKIDYISLNTREYYKKETNLIEKLRSKNYSKIILFDYNTNIFRNIECFVTNYNESINTLVFFLDYNSYNFKIDFIHNKIESLKFQQVLNNKNNMLESQKEYITNNSSNDAEKEEKYNIIVDYREMGTKTPFFLYKNNFNIINGSLEVGDYILTNNHCIERKSISTKDFYQSLNNSKHLIEQTIKMGKYYKNIIILLEFEETIDIINTFENGICYKPIIMRKLLDLTNITELEKNNCLFIWSLNCKMSSKLLKNLRKKLNKEILDINYCLNINKINKGNISKNQKKNDMNNKDINNIHPNSQQMRTIDSFFCLNTNNNKQDENIEKYETQNDNELYINEIMNKKIGISTEKIIRNIPGIDSHNYNLITNNFNNLYELITCQKEKKYELFGRINGTKIFSLFNYEYQ